MPTTLPALPGTFAAPYPVLLLPVSVQVKFVQPAAGPQQLWVRIYPDQLSISTHEEPLTAAEWEAGQAWLASPQDEDHWRALVARFGAPRAQWLIGQVAPAPAPAPTPAARRWSRAAEARGLPRRFAVLLYQPARTLAEVAPGPVRELLYPAGQAYDPAAVPRPTTELLRLYTVQEGRDIDPSFDLAMGPDPSATAAETATGGVDAGNLWTVDFEAACQAGMALKIDLVDDKGQPLPAAEVAAGFARLLVVGVRPADDTTPEARTGAPVGHDTFGALLAGHAHTSGVRLVPQGTPTNNTDTGPAGYSSAERRDADASFALLSQPPRFDAGLAWDQRPDGQHLARTLGLPDAAVAGLPGAHAQHDVAEAVAFNRALWPATYGYFLEEMLRPLLSADALDWTRTFFEANVLARGVAPALRVGPQPYGVLATTRFSAWEIDPTDPARDYAQQLQRVLGQLDATWTERLNPQPGGAYPNPVAPGGAVAFADEPADTANLLSTLGLEATSGQYFQRYLIGPLLAEALQAHATTIGQDIWPAGQQSQPSRVAADNPAYQDFARLVDPAGQGHLLRDGQGQPVPVPPIFTHTFQQAFTKLAEAYPDEPGAKRQEGVLIDAAPLSETALVAALPGVTVPDPATGELRPAGNYLQWLGTASFDDVRLERFASAGPEFVAPTALLYQLLRQAVLLQYWAAAKAHLHLTDPQYVQESETFNVGTSGQVPRWAWLYKLENNRPLHQVLAQAPGPLADYLAAVAALGQLPTARLERLLAEHLDLGSYRLDAWRLAPVAERLRHLRAAQPTGTHLGAFGWLEDLRPQDHATPNADGTYADPDNLGYLHAPGLPHATAAALLRQGYKSRQLTADPHDPVAGRMAVDISSRRTRTALELLEGLRGGHSLGTLLGQRFERAVQAAPTPAGGVAFARYLPVLRAAFPLSNEHLLVAGPDQPAPSGTAPEQAARQVVDGAALLRAAAQQPAYPHGVYGADLPAAGSACALFLTAELGRLADDLDALGDLGVSEGLFQAARGNTDRATAVLDGVARGQFPPEPEFVHPPQRGFTLTQRVLVQLPAALPSGSGWPAATPRALLAPRLNAWLAQFLPEPAALSFRAGWRPAGGAVGSFMDIPLTATGLNPLDWLNLVTDSALQEGSDLDRLLRYQFGQYKALADQAPTGPAAVAIDYAASPAAKELRRRLPLLARLRQLLAGARPALPADLLAPGALATADAGVDSTPLHTQLQDATDALALAADPAGPALTAADFYQVALGGVPEALPGLAPGADLAAATRALRAALAPRLTQARAAVPASGATVGHYLAQARALFGADFQADVEFALADANTTDPARRAAQRAYEAALQPAAAADLLRYYKDEPLALQEWLHGLGAVREPLNHLDKVLLVQSLLADADAAATGTAAPEPIAALRPAQFTATPGTAPDGSGGDYWLGLPWPTAEVPDPQTGQPRPPYAPPGDALSLVQWLPAGYDPAAPQAALWLDEWTETLPEASQPTAVSFHYDQPNSAAPQAMLLVVPPQAQPSGSWATADLVGALNETLDLAKKRTVEPAALAFTPLATVLPAVVAPVAQQAVTLALDLGRVNNSARFNATPLLAPPSVP